jgi:hypothetical protein
MQTLMTHLEATTDQLICSQYLAIVVSEHKIFQVVVHQILIIQYIVSR